jgi:FemAB-related protein (PEP-CTERM system-associated)
MHNAGGAAALHAKDGMTAGEAGSSALTVRPMTDGDVAAWDRFVAATPGATFFHRAGWKEVLESVFGMRTYFLIAERSGEICGILPLVHQKSMIFGNVLSSTPFCVEGGPVASDPAALAALDAQALALMEQTRASSLEYRSRKASRPDWAVKTGLYASFARPITGDDKANLLAIPRKQRAVLRKTLEGGLTSTVDESAARLFRVYSESVRNLGTPVFPLRYFEALRRVFGKDCDIVVILDGEKPVSAVMNFYFRDTVMPYYGGGIAEARKNGANDFLYWEVMRRAAERGYRRFDFGRSKADSGAFAFKKNWGFEPEWLEYEYRLKAGASLPHISPSNPKFGLFIAAWKKLPLSVANFLGPMLIRYLG